MADLDFENPTFDPDGSGDHIQSLRGELREAELEAQKKRLFYTFYKEVTEV